MGKSGRHKKLSRQEKSKTHLKGVKTLLKAQNVVNPTLRVKKLMIREQLIDAPEGQVSTRRKQTVQEILSALNHHNTNIRKDALAGLQELVTSRNILKQNLDKILERVASLTSDLESSVRKENLKVAELIFQRVEESQIKPFWNLLLTHLKCTLTNLNPTIRYSTLPALNLLVTYFPNLVLGSKSIILPSLLGLISTPGTSSSSAPGSANTPRLNVEISGRHDEVRQRLRVFSLIGSCLELKEKISAQQNNSTEKEPQQVVQNVLQQDNNISIFSSKNSFSEATFSNQGEEEDALKNQYLGIHYPSGYDRVVSVTVGGSSQSAMEEDEAPVDILGTSHQATNSSSSDDDENQFWPRFVQSALSCLIETWVEAGPSSTDSSEANSASAHLEPKKKKSTPKKPGPEKQHQSDFTITGNDKSSSLSKNSIPNIIDTGTPKKQRGRISTNLSQSAVDSLSILVDVMGHLILSKNSNPHVGNSEAKPEFNIFLEPIRKIHGTNLKKYFFNNLPYVPIQDSNRAIVTTLNLKIFLIIAHLQLLDSNLMNKLLKLMQELIDGQLLDTEQCNIILRFFCCIDPSRERPLCTRFIVSTLSMKNHKSLIRKFLRRILRPENRSVEEMSLIEEIDWEVVTSKLLETCGKISARFMTLLTFIAIRKLADVKKHLLEKISIFEEQLQSSSSIDIWDSAVRLFSYANSLNEFKNSFVKLLHRQL